MASWIWIVVIVAMVIVVAVAAAQAARRSRTAGLRRKFGPEYDRTVAGFDSLRSAEANLRAREDRRARVEVRPLSEASRVRYAEEWHAVQEHFVDEPAASVTEAGTLLTRVMAERGYTSDDPASRIDLVSVDYPGVVEDYRAATRIRQRDDGGQASTEDLREALVRYRRLFEALLGAGQPGDGQPAAHNGSARTPRPETPARSDPAPGTTAASDAPRPQDTSQQTLEMETGDDGR